MLRAFAPMLIRLHCICTLHANLAALHFAAAHKHAPVFEVLVTAGANADAVDVWGVSAKALLARV